MASLVPATVEASPTTPALVYKTAQRPSFRAWAWGGTESRVRVTARGLWI